MADIISCLRYEHDYRLVLLALAICAGTAVLAFYVHDIARLSSGHRKACWIVFTGVIAGGWNLGDTLHCHACVHP